MLSPSCLGKVIVSPKADIVLSDSKIPLGTLLERHRQGDWGIVSPEDRAVNTESITDGNGPVISIYDDYRDTIFVRTINSPFKAERLTEVMTGWEIN